MGASACGQVSMLAAPHAFVKCYLFRHLFIFDMQASHPAEKPPSAPVWPRLTHRHVEVFHALMTCGSVTAAAQALLTSQPTVSRELAHLEQRLGMPLFERWRGRLHPTVAAVALFDEVQRSFVGLERIAATAQQLREQAGPQLSVLCLPLFGQSLLPQAWARVLRRRGPRATARLRLTLQESPVLEQWLSAQSHDLGLIERSEAPPGTQAWPLLQWDEVVVLPPSHPLGTKTVIELADFHGQAFVTLGAQDPYRQQWESVCAAASVRPDVCAETPSADSVCALVAQGVGLAVINPLTALQHARRGLVLRRLAVSLPFQVSLVRPMLRPVHPDWPLLEAALQEEVAAVQHALQHSLDAAAP
jgi:DNA-binding transcriptional LysR family regulator